MVMLVLLVQIVDFEVNHHRMAIAEVKADRNLTMLVLRLQG